VRIYVVSVRNLASELLAHALAKEVNATCEILPALADLAESLKPRPDDRRPSATPSRTILLVDCIENDFDDVIRTLSDQQLKPGENLIVAIYNVYPGWGIEEEVLRSGVRGFFYKQDSLALFLKGINALLAKEVWVSREILMRSALRGVQKTQAGIQEKTGLSAREIEILRLLGSGAGNEEIAGRLFISQNTVKTHLYNVFKKLNVSSRLEAAAWAAKNL
jgi:DNA-binding NarL/FixJ family response regulator